MIAKAKVITHGSTAVGYSAEKELADIVKVNNLPEGITPAAMWSRMMTLQEKYREKLNRHRPMVNTSIRIEVSPAEEETVGWTLDDWRKLTDEFIREFDAIDLSGMAKRKSAKSTKLQNSQYVVSLHHDGDSGIVHLREHDYRPAGMGPGQDQTEMEHRPDKPGLHQRAEEDEVLRLEGI